MKIAVEKIVNYAKCIANQGRDGLQMARDCSRFLEIPRHFAIFDLVLHFHDINIFEIFNLYFQILVLFVLGNFCAGNVPHYLDFEN